MRSNRTTPDDVAAAADCDTHGFSADKLLNCTYRSRVERRNVVIDNIARIRSKETASGIEALKRKIALAYSF